ncbi:glycoside hydrolase superfamily [Obelidium mucronatum]|nr:glycoside hydrolase superfamily [Obelidium mucronatum]
MAPYPQPFVQIASSRDSGWWQPQIGDAWQWQLADGTTVAKVKSAQPNRKVICYVNVGSLEKDGSRADEKQFLPSDLGDAYPGWPGEFFVDIRSDNVRKIMQARFQEMKSAGCDGIEPDNMYLSYKGTGGFPTKITEADQVDYIKWFTGSIHDLGLAIGAKNGGDLLAKHPELFNVFDFAVVEECTRNKNCGQYSPFVDSGKPVFAADYLDAGSDGGCTPIKGTVEAACDVLNSHNFEGIIKKCSLSAAVTQCRQGTPPPPETIQTNISPVFTATTDDTPASTAAATTDGVSATTDGVSATTATATTTIAATTRGRKTRTKGGARTGTRTRRPKATATGNTEHTGKHHHHHHNNNNSNSN